MYYKDATRLFVLVYAHRLLAPTLKSVHRLAIYAAYCLDSISSSSANMGISGLLTVLKPIQVTRHLSEFAGQTLAVDAYVWLHRGIYTCATELATGKSTKK